MNETMREHLKHRQRWYLAAFVLGLALVLVPISLANVTGRAKLREHRELYLLSRLTGLGVLLGASLLRARVKCPKCSRPLGAAGRSGVPAFCPNCGVSFDEPMPPQPISPIS